eukprot:3718655-Amphidinium_carterae.1
MPPLALKAEVCCGTCEHQPRLAFVAGESHEKGGPPQSSYEAKGHGPFRIKEGGCAWHVAQDCIDLLLHIVSTHLRVSPHRCSKAVGCGSSQPNFQQPKQ